MSRVFEALEQYFSTPRVGQRVCDVDSWDDFPVGTIIVIDASRPPRWPRDYITASAKLTNIGWVMDGKINAAIDWCDGDIESFNPEWILKRIGYDIET